LSWPGIIRRGVISIRVGQPYHPPRARREQLPELTADLMARIAALLPSGAGNQAIPGPSAPTSGSATSPTA